MKKLVTKILSVLLTCSLLAGCSIEVKEEKDKSGHEYYIYYMNKDATALKKEKYDRIRKALKFITEKERKIIILYYIRELKLTEIGALLRMPTSTVHKTKDKAIKRIKEILNIHD